MSTATATATKPKGTSPTLPFDPLWEKARDIAGANGPIGPTFTPLDFAELVGHNVKAIKRWEQAGVIPWTSADRAAVRMGVHPMAVWGYDWLEIMGDYDEIDSGEIDKKIQKDLDRAESKGEVVKDGKILGRGWTELARKRQERAEAELLEQQMLDALYPVEPLEEDDDIFSDLDDDFDFVSLEDAGLMD